MKRLQIPRAQPGAGQASCTDVQVGDKENRWQSTRRVRRGHHAAM